MKIIDTIKKIFIILLLLSSNYLCSQTYSEFASDIEINELMSFYIDKIKEGNYDKKVKRKKIRIINVKWHEAFISFYSKDSLNSFDFQFEEILRKELSTSRNYINRGKKQIKDIFNKKDIAFMKIQFNKEKNITWNFKTKKGKFSSNPKRNYYAYSLPLFSINKDKAIIFKENYCGGHCGGSRIEVFLKKNNKWILYKSIGLWES